MFGSCVNLLPEPDALGNSLLTCTFGLALHYLDTLSQQLIIIILESAYFYANYSCVQTLQLQFCDLH